MKKLMSILIIGILAMLFFSCPEPEPETPEKTFWAQNFTNGSFYGVKATLLASGSHCEVWVEDGSGVSAATASNIANEYDNIIRSKMLGAFSTSFTDPYDGKRYDDIMQFALSLTGQSKLTILLLDIKDSFNAATNPAFTDGYFWSGNFFPDSIVNYSNSSTMIYVDTNPGKPGTSSSNITLAHEMQHLMNFAYSYVYRVVDGTVYGMDTWVDEGLSSAAEWVYSGGHSSNRLRDYNQNVSKLLDKGNNFYVWGNHEKTSTLAILDDYSTVYLFFQWLRLQSGGGTGIYKDIISSEFEDHWAVTEAAGKFTSNSPNAYANGNWGILLRDWLAANYIRSTSTRYGYRGDTTLNSITRHVLSSSATSISLFPGEGVYSKGSASFTSIPTTTSGAIIKYAALNTTISENTISSTDILLTYNVSTDLEGIAATGTTTGIANINTSPGQEGRFVSPPLPFKISGSDMLRRNGRNVPVDSRRVAR